MMRKCARLLGRQQAKAFNISNDIHRGLSNCHVICLNQPLSEYEFSLWQSATLRIAADGAANRVRTAAQKYPSNISADAQVIIGDLDSITQPTREHFGNAKFQEDKDQNRTDFMKCLQYIKSMHKPPEQCLVIGGLGGFKDHEWGILNALSKFALDSQFSKGLYLIDPKNVIFTLPPGESVVNHNPAYEENRCGIVNFGLPTSRITTNGLVWELTGLNFGFAGDVGTSTSNRYKDNTTQCFVETPVPLLWVTHRKKPTKDKKGN